MRGIHAVTFLVVVLLFAVRPAHAEPEQMLWNFDGLAYEVDP